MARFYSRPRDDQRSAVYKAERAAFQGRLQQQDVSTPERMRRRLDQILLSPWFLTTYPKTAARQIGLEFGRLGGANANESRIRLGRNAFAMQEWILIHELSHVVVRREIVDAPQGHGHEYCDVYLKLAEQFLAAGAADQLRTAFDARRVRYSRASAIAAPQPATSDEPTTTLAAICQSLNLDPRLARRRLRAAGLRAPYTNSQAILTILKR